MVALTQKLGRWCREGVSYVQLGNNYTGKSIAEGAILFVCEDSGFDAYLCVLPDGGIGHFYIPQVEVLV